MAALIIALLEHPEIQRQVSDGLMTAGHDVLVVDCFSRAKAVLTDHSFDLIISDVHLENGGTVFDFLKWTRTDPNLRHIPFVLFSVEPTTMAKYLADGVQTTARVLGAAKYISMDKFDSAIFVREIDELLPLPNNETVRAETTPAIVISKEGQ